MHNFGEGGRSDLFYSGGGGQKGGGGGGGGTVYEKGP